MKKYEELVSKAIDMLKEDDDLFCSMVNELISWNGFIDVECFPMEELDDILYGKKPSEVIDLINDDFNIRDNYFYWDMWGLHSTDYMEDVYRDNTTAEEVFDEVLSNLSHIYIDDTDFEELMEEIDNYSEDEEEENEE